MNSLAKVFRDFKEFYNEINGATLTGAIDVVVVEQEDGSLTCSPFHVRFGKLGVLRSREKVVDIEVNGEPVDIHMKLGESGEAFFVEEVSDDDNEEVPANLATSPIPTNQYLYEDDDNIKFSPINSTAIDELQMPKPRRNSIDLTENQSAIAASVTAMDDLAMVDKKYENQVSDFSQRRHTEKLERRDLSESKKEFTTQKIRQEWAEHEHEVQLLIQDESTSNLNDLPVEKSQPEAIPKTAEEAVEVVAEEGPVETKEEPVKEETKSKKKRRKKSIMKKKNAQRKNSSSSSNGSTHSEHPDHDTESLSSSQKTAMNASSSTDNTPTETTLNDFPSKAEETGIVEAKNTDVFKPIAAEPQTPSSSRIRDLDIHFFSDTEVATGLSRTNSRPSTPVQSDTEFEMNQREDSSNAGVMTHSASWKWGQLPTQTELDTTDAKQSHRNSLMNVFSFMKQNNKIRKGVSEGIYLADLDAEGMDPEVAALYFPKRSFSSSMAITQPSDEDRHEDDRESGNGTSLPQSPSSVDLGLKSIDSDYDDGKDKCLDFIALSMCGGLETGGPTKEEFEQQLVTYSEVCRNPALFSSPNLVVRLNNKYYSWAAACPIVMTMITFRKPLPNDTIDQLMDSSVPKAITASTSQAEPRFSWIPWRRSTDKNNNSPKQLNEIKGEMDQTAVATQTSRSTSPEKVELVNDSSMSRNVDTRDLSLSSTTSEINQTLEESSKLTKSSKEKFKKSLRLSTEQIVALNLKKGVNEMDFSVTTAYQGTSRCKCFVFRWKYNDKVVISDVDGTITRSDVLGHLLPIVGKDWAQIGVAELFSKIEENGYRMLYLSARAIGQSRATREYLRSIRQGDVNLPDGPLLLNPTSLLSAFHREVIEKKPELFKIACLNDIKELFPSNPFYAGYGNRINDVWAYRAVGIPIERIFTINTKGELRHELTQTFQSSYCSMAYIADQLFPPVKENDWSGDDEYTSFNFWRDPVPEVELEIDGVVTAPISSGKASPVQSEGPNSANTSLNAFDKSNSSTILSTIPEN